MEAHGVEPNEATLTSVARRAAARRDLVTDFSLVRRMAAAGTPPRLQTYGPALFAFCDAGDVDRAGVFRAHMDTEGSCPRRPSSPLCSVSIRRVDEVYRVPAPTRNWGSRCTLRRWTGARTLRIATTLSCGRA